MSRITNKARYGEHIELICINHPALVWSTKNIDSIGCRTIFYNLGGDIDYPQECDCKSGSLMVSPQYMELPDVPE